MWAQLITMHIKPDMEEELSSMLEQLRAAEQPDSGLLRQVAMRDHQDPNRIFMLVVFESEEKARAREIDPRREESLKGIRELMLDIVDGPREFVDLDVIADTGD